MQRLFEQNTPLGAIGVTACLTALIGILSNSGCSSGLSHRRGLQAFSIRGNFAIEDKPCTERAELLDINCGVSFTEVRSTLQILA